MKRILATLIGIFTLTSVFGQEYQVGSGFNKTNNSIPTVYKTNNQGTAGSGVLFISDEDSLQMISKDGFLGIGTSTPTQTLDVFGTAKIHNSDNSSVLFRGLYEGLVLGALPLNVNGAGGIDTSGNWIFVNYSGADNLTQEVGATNIGINVVTGDFRIFRLDSNIVQLGLGNILTYPDGSGDVELQLGANNNNAEWSFRDKTSYWAVKDSLGVDIVSIGETNGLTYVDGDEASGKVLTSDGSGNASWANINTVDASTIPVYANNAAAVAAIGAGKFYYVDVLGEYEVRITH